MKWTLAELHRYHDEPLHIQSTFDLNASLTERFPNQVLNCQPVEVGGYVVYDQGDATISVNVKTTLTVPSSRSLKPVELPLDFAFAETYVNDETHAGRYEDDDLVFVLPDPHDTIDFDNVLAENIIEQIPMQVLSEDEKNSSQMPNGKGWEVIAEDNINQAPDKEHVDPRFAKLKNLFPDQDNQN